MKTAVPEGWLHQYSDKQVAIVSKQTGYDFSYNYADVVFSVHH